MAITLSILNGFSKFFHCWKERIFPTKHIILPTIHLVSVKEFRESIKNWQSYHLYMSLVYYFLGHSVYYIFSCYVVAHKGRALRNTSSHLCLSVCPFVLMSCACPLCKNENNTEKWNVVDRFFMTNVVDLAFWCYEVKNEGHQDLQILATKCAIVYRWHNISRCGGIVHKNYHMPRTYPGTPLKVKGQGQKVSISLSICVWHQDLQL